MPVISLMMPTWAADAVATSSGVTRAARPHSLRPSKPTMKGAPSGWISTRSGGYARERSRAGAKCSGLPDRLFTPTAWRASAPSPQVGSCGGSRRTAGGCSPWPGRLSLWRATYWSCRLLPGQSQSSPTPCLARQGRHHHCLSAVGQGSGGYCHYTDVAPDMSGAR
jgi:hypothetical protein